MNNFQEPRVGRPPIPDEEKMDRPFRCLGTSAVKEYWKQKANEMEMTESELLRLAIFNLIRPWMDAASMWRKNGRSKAGRSLSLKPVPTVSPCPE